MISLFRIDRQHVNLAYHRSVEIQPFELPEFSEENDIAGHETDPQRSVDAPASENPLLDAEPYDFAANEQERQELADEISEAERAGIVEMLKKTEEAQAILDEAELEAQQIIEAADIEAEEIIKAANEQAEKVLEDARQQGHSEGYDAGLEEGKLVYDNKSRQDDEYLAGVIAELHKGFEEAKIGLEAEVLDLSLQILRKVINFSSEEDYEPFMPMLKNALKHIRLGSKVYIRTSAEQYERFFSTGSANIELDGGITVEAAVLREYSMKPGGVIIDTDSETINAGFETQLKQLELIFKQHVQATSPEQQISANFSEEADASAEPVIVEPVMGD